MELQRSDLIVGWTSMKGLRLNELRYSAFVKQGWLFLITMDQSSSTVEVKKNNRACLHGGLL